MEDDQSEKLKFKKIPLIKKKENLSNFNNYNDKEQKREKGIINLKMMEAINNINAENSDLKNMNFEEAYTHLDNKLSNLIDGDKNNTRKNIQDEESEENCNLHQPINE